jgi:hypothetical protein
MKLRLSPDTSQKDLDALISDHNRYQSENAVIWVLDNQRVYNLFKSGVLNISNFEKEYYKYLDYGLVIIAQDNCIWMYNDIYGAYGLYRNDSTICNFFSWQDDSAIDELALIQTIHFNHVLGKHTLLQNDERLPGGSKIVISASKLTASRLLDWDALVNLFQKHKDDSPEEHLENCLHESINNKGKLSLTLTGGYDSRMLLSLMLRKKLSFDTVTWGMANNLQASTAKELSHRFGIQHHDFILSDKFFREIERYFEKIIAFSNETTFITDVPQFLFMCEQLSTSTNLVCGFMGSEIIRGPSYSSQVTLTKFAADICLSVSEDEIRNHILAFQRNYPFIKDSVIERNMDQLVHEYCDYAQLTTQRNFRNSNIFKYLFFEKYAKIYGHLIKCHYEYGINLINPYMDFRFIAGAFARNKALSELTPFRNSFINNFFLYRFYAKSIAKLYPPLLNTKMDRGYLLKDLVTLPGLMKLIPLQVYRKYRKKKGKVVKVVDAYSWYEQIINRELAGALPELENYFDYTFLHSKLKNPEQMNGLDKIKMQFILALHAKINAQ